MVFLSVYIAMAITIDFLLLRKERMDIGRQLAVASKLGFPPLSNSESNEYFVGCCEA